MKKSVRFFLVLMTSLLVLGGVASAEAGTGRKITGGFHWSFSVVQVQGLINVHEVAPGEAKGTMMSVAYHEELGERRWKADAICVAFAEEDGEPAASLVFQLNQLRGWGAGEVGQYAKAWVSDGGTPASEGDKLRVLVFGVDVQPSCDYENPPFEPWALEGGNLVIHQ